MTLDDIKKGEGSVVDEFLQKVETPLRMVQIYNVTLQVRECKDPKIVMRLMRGIKPEIDAAIKDGATKLEALYRAQVMQVHLDGLIIDGLKAFYIASLKALRLEIDEKVAEINAFVAAAKDHGLAKTLSEGRLEP